MPSSSRFVVFAFCDNNYNQRNIMVKSIFWTLLTKRALEPIDMSHFRETKLKIGDRMVRTCLFSPTILIRHPTCFSEVEKGIHEPLSYPVHVFRCSGVLRCWVVTYIFWANTLFERSKVNEWGWSWRNRRIMEVRNWSCILAVLSSNAEIGPKYQLSFPTILAVLSLENRKVGSI